MTVDIWSNESRIYPKIDAEGMRGGDVVIEKFDLGDGFIVDVKIQKYADSDFMIENSIPIKGLKISLNFRKGNEIILRADNDHGGLHIHPTGSEDYRIPIQDSIRLSQFISDVFEESKKRISKSSTIVPGKGFVGFA